MKFKDFIVICTFLILVFLTGGAPFAGIAQASELEPVREYNVQQTTIDITDYNREDSTFQLRSPNSMPYFSECNVDESSLPEEDRELVTCRNFVSSNVTATFECRGRDFSPSGGWSLNGGTNGACWSRLDFCYYSGTIDEYCEEVAAPMISAAINSSPASDCSGSDKVKGACSFNPLGSKEVILNTGDDMFSLEAGAKSFFEYQALQSSDDSLSLRYFLNNSGQNIMVPSGPFTSGGSGSDAYEAYDDYRAFLNNHPAGVSIEQACYPTRTTICQTLPEPTPPVGINGQCGAANGAHGDYLTQGNIPAASWCNAGILRAQAQSATQITWQCVGRLGGSTASCNMQRPRCGAANNGQFYTQSEVSGAGYCAHGAAANISETATSFSWNCNPNVAGGTGPACSASKRVDGVCASFSGAHASQPANGSNGCSQGTYADVSDTAGNYLWTCSGINGGTDASCSASKNVCAPGPGGGSGGSGGTAGCVDECGESRAHGDTWCRRGGNPSITPTMECVNGSVSNMGGISGIGCDAGGTPVCP